MNHEYNPNQRGQSLVFFAILTVAGLIFLALIIDGGGAYAMRRLAQNAADAGALAGAREYCISGNAYNVIQTANDYATEKNLARLANVISQTADVTLTGPYVNVITNIVYETFFARILGMDQMTAVAEAEAGCFAPSEGKGVIPVAWECRETYSTGEFDSDCDLEFMNPLDDEEDNSCDFGEDPLYIFLDLGEEDPIIACDHWPESDLESADYILDCGGGQLGTEEDPIPLIELISPYHPDHGWMWANLDGGSGDSDELEDWITEDPKFHEEPPIIETHWWIAGMSGTKIPGDTAIREWKLDDTVIVPVFDDRCHKTENPEVGCYDPVTDQWVEPNPGWHPGLDSAPYLSGGVDTYFHVATFALLEVNCVDAPGSAGACAARNWLVDNNLDILKKASWSSINSFEGCFKRGFHPGLFGRPADGAIAGAFGIYLVK